MNDKIDRDYMIRFFKEPKGPPFPLLYFKKSNIDNANNRMSIMI